MAASDKPVRVAVAGGGIAGMTTALRLAQRGYAVTLYEEKPWLGGNAGSHRDPDSGVYHDVYPHMFSNFYVNFWDICENELGLKRTRDGTTDFEARDAFLFLSKAGGYSAMRNATTTDPRVLWRDLFSGAAQMSPLDIWLYMYSMVDLLAHRFDDRGLLGWSVNGFVRSRPTTTMPVAQMHDAIVMFIWSIHASGTSAGSYQNFYRHTFGNVDPLLWLLRGSLQEKVINPLEQRLVELGCTVHKNTSVQRLAIEGNRATVLELQPAEFDWDKHQVKRGGKLYKAEPFDHLVLALPPEALGRLVESGPPGRTLATAMPLLAHAGERLPSEPIAVMDLYFKVKLDGIPKENIAVTDSDNYFSIIDLSELWPEPKKLGVTALTLAASDYWALPSDDDNVNAHVMIMELHGYLKSFRPGRHWGDPDSDIDWERSAYHSNEDNVIFVNQVGSWRYRPETQTPTVGNLYFAGDFCRNQVDMATVEAAVTSGINAAAAVQANAPLGEPIELLKPPIVPGPMIGAFKLLLAPSAYMAKALLTAAGVAKNLAAGEHPGHAVMGLTTIARLPWDYVVDMVDTVGSMAADALPAVGMASSSSEASDSGAPDSKARAREVPRLGAGATTAPTRGAG
jgi:Flavin containing amine oxidoreductase